MPNTKTDRELVLEGIDACRYLYSEIMRSDKLFRMVRNGQLKLGPIVDWAEEARRTLESQR